MATTVAFDLCSKLFDVFTAAVPAGVRVYDGPGFSQDPGNFLMVGVDDPESESPTSAQGTQAWSGLGNRAALEDGVITCCAVAVSGDSGDAAQKAVRQSVRDLVATVDAALHADPNLGGAVPGLNWVRYGTNYRLTQPAISGVAAFFYFEVAYKARLV